MQRYPISAIIVLERRRGMERKKLHIDIDTDVKEKLDKISKERGLKTNQLIRFIIFEFLLKEKKK